MKIRIKGNSVRIRITKSELDNFGRDGYLEEKTEFGDKYLSYRLEARDGIDNLEAAMNSNTITMFVPEPMKQEWVHTDVVGYNNNMDIGNGKKLFLLIEKDFKCIDGEVLEDQSDNFDNPLQACP
jgi:hypothetical protein